MNATDAPAWACVTSAYQTHFLLFPPSPPRWATSCSLSSILGSGGKGRTGEQAGRGTLYLWWWAGRAGLACLAGEPLLLQVKCKEPLLLPAHLPLTFSLTFSSHLELFCGSVAPLVPSALFAPCLSARGACALAALPHRLRPTACLRTYLSSSRLLARTANRRQQRDADARGGGGGMSVCRRAWKGAADGAVAVDISHVGRRDAGGMADSGIVAADERPPHAPTSRLLSHTLHRHLNTANLYRRIPALSGCANLPFFCDI